MTREEVIATLKDVIRRAAPGALDPDAVSGDSTIEALGFDSLSLLDLAYDVQQAFGVEIDMETFMALRTVNDLVDALASRTRS